MTNTVFSTFQTQYILDFSTASRTGTLGFAKALSFSRLKMLLLRQTPRILQDLILSTERNFIDDGSYCWFRNIFPVEKIRAPFLQIRIQNCLCCGVQWLTLQTLFAYLGPLGTITFKNGNWKSVSYLLKLWMRILQLCLTTVYNISNNSLQNSLGKKSILLNK
jgi:hypothetical protein